MYREGRMEESVTADNWGEGGVCKASRVSGLALPGSRHFREPNAWSYLANSSRDLALGDPRVNDSWNWTPATFTQSGGYPPSSIPSPSGRTP